MATTTLVFPVNPFSASEANAPVPQATRIDRKKSSIAGYNSQTAHVMGDSGTGALDDLFEDSGEEKDIDDPMADSSTYCGTQVSIYV
jgi:hypothetical protein